MSHYVLRKRASYFNKKRRPRCRVLLLWFSAQELGKHLPLELGFPLPLLERRGRRGEARALSLGGAPQRARRAEQIVGRLAAAAAPLEERKREPKFKGEMLPEFLGRKPEE